MADINDIFDTVISTIKSKKMVPSPNNYAKLFCKVAKDLNIKSSECRKVEEFVLKLTINEQKIIKEKNLTTFEDILKILLNRIEANTLDKTVFFITKALESSLGADLGDKLNKLVIRLSNKPEDICNKQVQDQILYLIEKRKEADRLILEIKTKEASKIINNIASNLNRVIKVSKQGGDGLEKLSDEIKQIDLNSNNLNDVHSKLITITDNIQQHVNSVTDNLEKENQDIDILKHKIKQLEQQLEKSQLENITDELTRVYNRKGFSKEVKKFEALYERNNVDYAIIFFDIDFFKKINDTYGHDAGDKILSTFAKLIHNSLRDSDIVARYGGEEFVALSVIKSDDNLTNFLKRLKLVVNEHKFKYKHHKISVTFSAGVIIRSKCQSIQDCIKGADELVYKAKNNGRNKICFDNGNEI